MDGEKKPDPGAFQAMASALEDISEKLTAMAKDAGVQLVGLAKKSRTNRRMIRILAASVALDIVLSVATVGALVIANDNTDRIDEVVRQQQISSTTTRRQALCPLYTLFREMRSPQGREAAEDPEQYDHAFDVIEKGYAALECDAFISEPQGPPGSTPTP